MTTVRLLGLQFALILTSLTPLATSQAADYGKESSDMIRQRDEWYRHQRAYPLEHIPAGFRVKALRKRQAMEAQARAIQASPTSAWTLVGPEPINTATPVIPFNGNPTASGRVTAIVVDPTNANVVYVGGADGGVWKTTNGGTSWIPLTDAQASLAVGAIALDPSNHNIIYVGTGEDNNNADGYTGAGILKSTDGGTTWTHIAGPFVGPFSSGAGGGSIGGLAVHPTNGQIVLAAVTLPGADGIYRSTDGGTTWTATGLSGSGLNGSAVVYDPTNGNNAFAAIGNIFGNATSNGVYKSTDAGVTWTLIAQTNPAANAGRIAIAIAPSSPTTLYVAIANSVSLAAGGGSLYGLFKTTDGGTTFTATSAPDFCGSDGTANQCWYDMALAVAPNNANVVYAAGKYTYASGAQTTVIGSTDGGTTWSLLGGGANGVDVHTDIHALAFSADSGRLYVGGDGGMNSTTNVAASTVNWADLNATLALSQFYNGMSVDPTNVHNALGGLQDNGPVGYTGGLTWMQPTSGDGGFTAIDPLAPTTIYMTTDNSVIKSTAGILGTFSDVTPNTGTDRKAFTAPLTIDPTTPSNLYFGTYRLYQTTDSGTTWTAISPDLTTGTGNVSMIAVAPNNSNTVYTGSDDSVVSVSVNALSGTTSTWTNVNPTGVTRSVTDIKVDPATSTTAYVTYGGFSGFPDTTGHVFKTTNGGTSWTDISGNLPNIPVTSIAVDPDVANTLYVGTDVGTFYTSNGGASWSTLGTGLPNVGVMALAFQHATRTLFAGTHGRSAWTLSLSTQSFLLTVTEAGTGTGTVTSSPTGINCPTTCSANFNSGTSVTLTATPASGSTFAGWSGACSGTGTCTVTMSAAQAVTATFNKAVTTFALTLTEAGTGSGTVTSSPAGISCPSTCSASFNSGTSVTLTATPTSGSTFAGWSGACTGTGTCTVTMNAAQSVTATFNVATFPLTVSLAGTGAGTVTSSPAGINCPGTCSTNFNSGSVVTLTATPASGSTFAGWSGACTGTGACSVTMSAARAVTATFNVVTFPLTVSLAGTGSGTVTSSPSGITCPGTCSSNFNSGTSVTLTATPASGSTFAGWSGACTNATGTCTVSMSAAKSVTATFNKTVTTFALTVSLAGTGTGAVASSPSGINCPGTCAANFNSGTVVTLTATPASGSSFTGWSGACIGTGSCSVTMNAAQALTATFTKVTFPLTVNLAGTGTGTVSSSPAGINCPGTCTANFNSGTLVTLTATPASGSTFAGWSQACIGTGTCTVTMSTARAATATFNLSSAPAVTFTPTSLSFGTVAIGVTSAAKTVTMKNTGTAALTITAIGITGTNSGDFARTATTCGASLAAGASCTISADFKPTASGARSAAISVTDNASGSPQKVPLAGIGTTAKLSPASGNFGTVAIGVTSAPKTVTLTNVGTTALSITAIAITGTNPGDFGQTHTCGSSLAAGASCTFSLTFKPTASGTRSASLSVTDNAGGSPQLVPLSGVGTTAMLSPTSLSFGSVKVGTISAAKTVTLKNLGTAALSITSIGITGANAGDFLQTHSCGSSLAAGASCTISVQFKPSATGARSAALGITDNAAGSPQHVSLSGTGS